MFSERYEVLYANFKETLDGIEMPHLHYPLYNHLGVADVPKFTVVRDPVDRFNSVMKVALKRHLADLVDIEHLTESRIEYFAEELHHNNWIRPQSEFIDDHTLVWNYSDGLGEQFQQWIGDHFGFVISNANGYDEMTYDNLEGDLNFSKDSLQVIEKYYEKDYEKFEFFSKKG